MAVLADQDIAREMAYGDLDVSPVDLHEQLQPNSLDIRLGREYSKPIKNGRTIDVKEGLSDDDFYHHEDMDKMIIHPGEFVLATTVEDFEIPDYLYAQVHGRSSIGRLGLEIHSTAGLIDSGYEGEITLEITNNSPRPIRLYSGMRIAQVVFHRLESRCNSPYSSEKNKYQGQEGVTPSRIDEDFE